jgi:hypothetical protein
MPSPAPTPFEVGDDLYRPKYRLRPDYGSVNMFPQQSTHVTAVTIMHASIEKLLEAVFSVASAAVQGNPGLRLL